jgi:hypothetical protein
MDEASLDVAGRPWSEPLWERQEGESARAFEGFATYRDLGPARSLAAVGQALGKTKAACEPWSSRWGWVERAAAWDDEADRLLRERDLAERAQARRQMLAEHARVGQTLVQIGADVLAVYDVSNPESGEAAEARIAALSASDAARLVATGAKLERLARGEPNERVGMREAMAWVAGFVEVALAHLPLEAQEAFLLDVDARLGVGNGLAG